MKHASCTTVLLPMALMLGIASQMDAQQGFTSAGGSSTLLLGRDTSAVTIDVAESAISLTRGHGGLLGGPFANTRLSFATQENKSTILAGGRFVPSATFERLEVLLTHPWTKVTESSVFTGVRLKLADNKYAVLNPGNSYTLDQALGTTVSGALGANLTHSGVAWRDFTIGGQVQAGSAWNSAGIRTAESVCVDKAAGDDGKGNPTRVTKCEDRFLGPLAARLTSGNARLDFVGLRSTLSGKDTTGAMLGWIAAASTDAYQNGKPSHNFSVGPALFRSNYPDVIVGALLVELLDAWDAAGEAPTLSERFSVRLYVGIPFKF